MARPIKLPPRAEIVRRLTGQRDLLRAKGNEAGASAIQRMIDAPITREWPEDGGTVANPADKAPKGCGHGGNPGDVCSDCSFTPHLDPRIRR